MNLKLTTLLALCIALPSNVASTSPQILVPEQWKDTTTIKGMSSTNGEVVTMSRATTDPVSEGQCACSGVYDPVCDTKYYGVTWIWFAEPTTYPRPITVTMGTISYDCTIWVNQVEKPIAWYVGWGMSGTPLALEGTKIVCERSVV